MERYQRGFVLKVVSWIIGLVVLALAVGHRREVYRR